MGVDVSLGEEVDRISAADLTLLATDRGPAPMHLGALLVLDGAADDDGVPDALVARAATVQRLRQRLRRTPLGGGRPYWVEDPVVDLRGHVGRLVLPVGSGWQTMLDAAADAVCTPLSREAPLWRAVWITGWDPTPACRGALVVVLHHVLVDGLGGLLLLARLADGAAPRVEPTQRDGDGAAAVPSPRDLHRDALRRRIAATRSLSRSLRRTVHGIRELGLAGRRPALAARTSLNRPTGARRRLAVVDVALADVVERAHGAGATVNDVVVAAVVGALETLLDRRGEHPRTLVVSVPISSRAPGEGGTGNHTGVLPVHVPTGADPTGRLVAVAAATAARRGDRRGSSAAPLGAAFRLLGRLGVFRLFVEHQRLVHTFETNVRGPAEPLQLAGHRIAAVLPVATNPGNVGVSFDVISYAGRLLLTVVADPQLLHEPSELAGLLATELGGCVL